MRRLTDGEREILAELNADAARDGQAEWDALPEEVREALADEYCRRAQAAIDRELAEMARQDAEAARLAARLRERVTCGQCGGEFIRANCAEIAPGTVLCDACWEEQLARDVA